MSYKIEFSDIAVKNLRKMDSASRKKVLEYIKDVISKVDNPRLIGKSLVGNLKGLWRYRTGNFRILCQITDQQMLILIVKIAHRKDIYK